MTTSTQIAASTARARRSPQEVTALVLEAYTSPDGLWNERTQTASDHSQCKGEIVPVSQSSLIELATAYSQAWANRDTEAIVALHADDSTFQVH